MKDPPAGWAHRAPTWIALAIVALVCVLLVQELSKPSIRLDGVGYYAPLASVVFDGDVDLRNEFAHASEFMRNAYFMRPDGSAVDPFAVGAAVLWAPAVLATRAFDSDQSRASRPARSAFGSPGFQPRYVRAIAVTTGLEALVGCFLLFTALRRWTGTLAATAGTAGAALGTPLVYYALAQPSYAHAASFLCVSGLLFAVVRDHSRRLPLAVLGALWGLAALVRWQDAVLGLLFAPRLLEDASRMRLQRRRFAAGLVAFVAAALVVFSPQLWFWNQVYGSPFVYTHHGFMRWFAPQVVPLLVSTWHGAFIYSPLLLVGFAGIACVPERGLRFALWGSVLLEIYACAAANDWWGGGGFSARRLTSVAPLAGVGIAWLVARVRMPGGAPQRAWRTAAIMLLVGVTSLWNLRLAQYNVRGLLPFNPDLPVDYIRHYPSGDVRRQPYGLWDHARLAGELRDAERQMWRR